MKTVFSNDDLVTAFYDPQIPKGRTMNNSRYFDGDTAWSYGPHYEAARLTNRVIHGKLIVLVNSEKNSVTTNGFTQDLDSAAKARGYRVLRVPLPFDATEAIADMGRRLVDMEGLRDRARSAIYRKIHAEHAEQLADDISLLTLCYLD